MKLFKHFILLFAVMAVANIATADDTLVTPYYVLKCEAAFDYINNLSFDDCDSIQIFYQNRIIEKDKYISTLERTQHELKVNYLKLETEAKKQAKTVINNPLYLSIQEENFLVKEKLRITETKLKKRNRLLIGLSIITSSLVIIQTL